MIKETRLDNGMVVVYEQLPHIKSVCIGIWIKSGSVNEDKDTRGASHFIEHMLFKGTEKRSARDIANIFDSVGGSLNAFTGKELTCFYAKTLDEYFEMSADVLSDMIKNSVFDEKMIKKEQRVVCEEISMYIDSPEDYIHDKLAENMWKGHPLSYPILGKRTTVKSFNSKILIDYMNQLYKPDNMIISVVGNFDEQKMIEITGKYFSDMKDNSSRNITSLNKPEFSVTYNEYNKNVEQTYLSMAMEGVGYDSDDKYPLIIASNVLGGGMSSRLFQHVREEKGLVYTIGSVVEAYRGTGILNIYAGTNAQKIGKLMECVQKEVTEIKNKGFTEDELKKAKDQLKGNLILSLENTDSRMSSMARSRLLREEIVDQDKLIEKINSVTNDDIKRVAQNAFDWDKKAVAILIQEGKKTANSRNPS